MATKNRLRVRMRIVRLAIDPCGQGLGLFDVDHEHAERSSRIPVPWTPLGFLGSRSGRGSTWIEVDLVFKGDLSPVNRPPKGPRDAQEPAL
jgi:hypothetical protein